MAFNTSSNAPGSALHRCLVMSRYDVWIPSCRDISNRRPLDPALRQRPRRLALEIDDDVILAGVQNLPQMEVAMDASALRHDLFRQQRAKPVDDFALPVEQLQRVVEHFAAKRF